MSKQKATLKVQLLADDTLIEESHDEALWQYVLARIKGLPIPSTNGQIQIEGSEKPPTDDYSSEMGVRSPSGTGAASSGATAKLARQVGVSVEEIEGALGPSNEEPYLQLDHRSWEAFKKNTPPRGVGSVAPIVLAATALVLLHKSGGCEDVSVGMAQAVLRTIDLRDANAKRGLKRSEWLKVSGEKITLNPAQLSKACGVIKAFCTKQSIE